jgi:hypothetical protein
MFRIDASIVLSDPRQARMTNLPTPHAAARIAAFLEDHLSWSAFWDKQNGLWPWPRTIPTLTCTPRAGTRT